LNSEIAKYYHDFDVLEDKIEWNGHGANTVNPVFYKGEDDGVVQRK
jgi:hypothetical protein